MRFIICLYVLVIAKKYTGTLDRGAAEKIKFRDKENTEVVEIRSNVNQKTIYSLGEELAKRIENLLFMQYDISDRINKELSISINKTNKELSISVNGTTHDGHKLADIVKDIKKESLVNTLRSLQKNIERIKDILKNGGIFSHYDQNMEYIQILLSKNEISDWINVLKIMEVITWYLYVKWIDVPSDAVNNKRKDLLETMAEDDQKWREDWDNILNEIHKLSNNATNDYDGVVPLSKSTLNGFYDKLLNFCRLSLLIYENVNKSIIETETDLKTNGNSDSQLFDILESMCAENDSTGTNIQLEIKKTTSTSAADKAVTHNMGKSTSPTNAQKNKQKPTEKTWF